MVGTKIPHYSVFGETVEIAGLMECTGESMKIQVNLFMSILILRLVSISLQISSETRDFLKTSGGFNYVKRESTHPKIPDGMTTFWLIGLTAGQEATVATVEKE